MDNWFVDKSEVKEKLENMVLDSLVILIDNKQNITANYWIDNTHNVFAFINDNGNGDRWIEIHYELYDYNTEIIGDLTVLNTDDVTKQELLNEIRTIVNLYFGD